MLCHAVLCCAVLCNECYAMICHAVPCYAMLYCSVHSRWFCEKCCTYFEITLRREIPGHHFKIISPSALLCSALLSLQTQSAVRYDSILNSAALYNILFYSFLFYSFLLCSVNILAGCSRHRSPQQGVGGHWQDHPAARRSSAGPSYLQHPQQEEHFCAVQIIARPVSWWLTDQTRCWLDVGRCLCAAIEELELNLDQMIIFFLIIYSYTIIFL